MAFPGAVPVMNPVSRTWYCYPGIFLARKVQKGPIVQGRGAETWLGKGRGKFRIVSPMMRQNFELLLSWLWLVWALPVPCLVVQRHSSWPGHICLSHTSTLFPTCALLSSLPAFLSGPPCWDRPVSAHLPSFLPFSSYLYQTCFSTSSLSRSPSPDLFHTAVSLSYGTCHHCFYWAMGACTLLEARFIVFFPTCKFIGLWYYYY